MVTIRYGPGFSETVGSIGGTTHQRSSAGPIIRTRTRTKCDRTTAQNIPLRLLPNGSCIWESTLTPTQRGTWNSLAALTTWTNRSGVSYTPSGRSLFLRHYVLWTYVGFAYRASSPAVADTPTPSWVMSVVGSFVTVSSFAGALYPAPTRVALWRSGELKPTINYPVATSVYLGTVVVTGPPAVPFNLISCASWPAARRYCIRLRVLELGNDPGPPVVSHNGTCSWQQRAFVDKP